MHSLLLFKAPIKANLVALVHSTCTQILHMTKACLHLTGSLPSKKMNVSIMPDYQLSCLIHIMNTNQA